jgi:hypothetical protein
MTRLTTFARRVRTGAARLRRKAALPLAVSLAALSLATVSLAGLALAASGTAAQVGGAQSGGRLQSAAQGEGDGARLVGRRELERLVGQRRRANRQAEANGEEEAKPPQAAVGRHRADYFDRLRARGVLIVPPEGEAKDGSGASRR